MQDIKAFVGHSFLKADEQIVRAFLDFFTQAAKLNPSFSWDHAENAEPKQLRDKILEKIEGKNTFIGICTKRELAIDEADLTHLRFWPKLLWAKKDDFKSKTSDWIIQEIGLAIGRGFELILLIEDGLDRPGGLQGDIEYITFKRNSPSDSFGKVMDMLSALSPKRALQMSGAIESKPQSENPAAEDKSNSDEPPQPDWPLEKFERAIAVAVIRQDTLRMEEIDNSFRTSKIADQPDAIATWDAHLIYMKIYFEWEGDLKTLIDVAKKYPTNMHIRGYLAGAYNEYTEHKKSAEEYEIASSLATDPLKKSRFLGRAAVQHQRAGNLEQTLKLLSSIRLELAKGNANELTLLEQLKEIFEAEKNDDLLLPIMERIAEIKPSDVGVRFELAYKHSLVGNDDLALHHYLKIPYEKRHGVTWNNLGVVYQSFELPIKSVDAYRKAKESNETLAMANLGYKFASVGFLEEARAEADKAFKQDHPHKNVGLLHAQLEEAPSKETEKLDEVLSKMKSKVDLYRQLGSAIILPEPANIPEKWQGPMCVFTLQRNKAGIRLTGSYNRSANALGILMGGILESAAPQIVRTIDIEVSQTGRAFFGHLRQFDGAATQKTLLGDDSQTTEVFIVVNEDCSEAIVAKNPRSQNPTSFSLKAIR